MNETSFPSNLPPSDLSSRESSLKEEDFLSKEKLSTKNVKERLEFTRQSFKSIAEMKPGVKYYFDETTQTYHPSAAWIERTVSELKGKDSFLHSYLGTVGETFAKALDVATWGAQSISRTYWGEDWKKTIAGFEKVWSELNGQLMCADELAEPEFSSQEGADGNQRENLEELKHQVEVVREDLLASAEGMQHLEESYAGTEKEEKVKRAITAFKESSLEKINDTLDKLTRRIQQLKEEHLSDESLSAREELRPIVFTVSLPNESPPPQDELKDLPPLEKAEVREQSDEVTKVQEGTVEVDEELEGTKDPQLESSFEKEVEVGRDEKEKEAYAEEREEKVSLGREEMSDEQSHLIRELEQLVDTPSSSPASASSSTNLALAKFDLNGEKLKNVLESLPKGMVLAMMLYVVNQWRIRNSLLNEREATKAYQVAKKIVSSLNINNKGFISLVRELQLAKLVTLKNCLVNYYYTKRK